ncbi:MAG: hypothetical protein U9N52_09720, partial [Campylobacterota bacterium]|nr:hypothetical protein [Campylobacterota bacterium]
LYDLQDAGYDADIIREFSEQNGHRPIIDINPKNSQVLRDKMQVFCMVSGNFNEQSISISHMKIKLKKLFTKR